MNILIVAIIVFVINIPFGYWRVSEKKFSVNWFLSIHLPIPLVVILRIYSNIGFAFYTYPILVASFFGGQFLGKILYKQRVKKNKQVTKCICIDLFNN